MQSPVKPPKCLLILSIGRATWGMKCASKKDTRMKESANIQDSFMRFFTRTVTALTIFRRSMKQRILPILKFLWHCILILQAVILNRCKSTQFSFQFRALRLEGWPAPRPALMLDAISASKKQEPFAMEMKTVFQIFFIFRNNSCQFETNLHSLIVPALSYPTLRQGRNQSECSLPYRHPGDE